MIEADPDVPNPLAAIINELGEATRPRQLKTLACGIRTEYRGACRPRVFKAQQAFVLGIEIEKEAVTDFKLRSRPRALRGEAQHRVGAVAVLVDQMFGRAQRARRAIERNREPRQRVRSELSMPRAQFTPRDLAIAIAVESDRKIKIAQRDVPLTV